MAQKLRGAVTDEEYIRFGMNGVGRPIDYMIMLPVTAEMFDNGEPSEEVKDWCRINAPSALYMIRLGMPSANGMSVRYGCFVFDTENELLFFKMRWFGGT